MMTCAHCNADFRRYVIGDCPEEAPSCDCAWHEHVRKCDRIAALERELGSGCPSPGPGGGVMSSMSTIYIAGGSRDVRRKDQ